MNIYSNISKNKWKTILIMVLFVLFITTLLYIFGKAEGDVVTFFAFGLIFSGITSIGSYYYSDKLVLATSGAKEVSESDAPQLYHLVENLCLGDGLPKPKIYIINDSSPNAFATGRDPNHATICVTSGILQVLNKVELEGVIAHELSHVKNYDTRLMAVVAILVGFVALIANLFLNNLWFRDTDERDNNGFQTVFLLLGVVFAILSPIIATLIQLAVSRKREFLADASGALL